MKHKRDARKKPQALDRFFTLRVRDVHIKIIDELRRQQGSPPSRQGMVRLLIENSASADLARELQGQEDEVDR